MKVYASIVFGSFASLGVVICMMMVQLTETCWRMYDIK
jgi:hypothetical protein